MVVGASTLATDVKLTFFTLESKRKWIEDNGYRTSFANFFYFHKGKNAGQDCVYGKHGYWHVLSGRFTNPICGNW